MIPIILSSCTRRSCFYAIWFSAGGKGGEVLVDVYVDFNDFDLAWRSSSTLARENHHDAKPDVEQPQGIGDQTSHSPHPPHGTKHPTATVRTPHNRQRT